MFNRKRRQSSSTLVNFGCCFCLQASLFLHFFLQHRQPTWLICHLCDIRYDYIIDIDNLSQELLVMLHLNGIDKVPQLTKKCYNCYNYENDEMVRLVRRNALKSLSKSTFHLFINRYKDDYEFFNITLPDFGNLYWINKKKIFSLPCFFFIL